MLTTRDSILRAMRVGLAGLDVPAALVEKLPSLPDDALGAMVYGSRARGDAVLASDLDVLVLVSTRRRSVDRDGVSVSYYTHSQLESGNGTLFGAHLARDGHVLADPSGALGRYLLNMGPVDTQRLLRRARTACCLFTCPFEDLPKYLPGLLRQARYLLRSCLYAQAIAQGTPCFSVREIAARSGDSRLVDLLGSRPQGAPEINDLHEILDRLRAVVGGFPVNDHGSLESLVVNLWGSPGDVPSMAFLALLPEGEGSSYAEVERILL